MTNPHVVELLRQSLVRRLDFLAGTAAAAGGTFELVETATGYQAMILPKNGAAIVGAGRTCSRATLDLLERLP